MTRETPRWLLALFLLPALIGLLIFRLYPIALAAASSFYESAQGAQVFGGLDNYAAMFGDPTFWQSVRVTLWFNLLVNPIQIALALGLALLYVRRFAGAGVYRVLFLIPIGVSVPTAVLIWKIMLGESGLVNGVLGAAEIPAQSWLTSSGLALYSIIAIATWKGVSYWMTFLVGGLQQIPTDIYEAARIDGVRPWQRTLFITLPLLRPALLFVLVADVSINFLLFAPIYMLTRGGPAGSTDVMMYEAYKQGFVFGDMGRAMAMVVTIVVMLLVIVGVQFKLLGTPEGRTR